MKKYILLATAVLALIFPIVLRGFWFYRGMPPERPKIEQLNHQPLTTGATSISNFTPTSAAKSTPTSISPSTPTITPSPVFTIDFALLLTMIGVVSAIVIGAWQIFLAYKQLKDSKYDPEAKKTKPKKSLLSSKNSAGSIDDLKRFKTLGKSNERVMILIDGENLAAISKNDGITIDFSELRSSLQKVFGKNLSLNYYAHNETAADIFSSLSKLQYRVYLESHLRRKLADSQIGIDIIEQINEFNTFVILSGDGYFTNLVENLRLRGKQVIIVSIPKSTSNLLIQKANSFINLKELLPNTFSES